MTRIWITRFAFAKDRGGAISVDVPEELLADGWLRLPREYLEPWTGRSIFFVHDIGRDWHRSEEEAETDERKHLERQIRKAARELEEAKRALADLKKNGLRMARTVAELKAARAAKKVNNGR